MFKISNRHLKFKVFHVGQMVGHIFLPSLSWQFDLGRLLCVFPGHFTQVVWKGSTELGVGMATNGNKVYVVGQYRPPGNINTKEYFEKNVGQLGNYSVKPILLFSTFCYVTITYTIIYLNNFSFKLQWTVKQLSSMSKLVLIFVFFLNKKDRNPHALFLF